MTEIYLHFRCAHYLVSRQVGRARNRLRELRGRQTRQPRGRALVLPHPCLPRLPCANSFQRGSHELGQPLLRVLASLETMHD